MSICSPYHAVFTIENGCGSNKVFALLLQWHRIRGSCAVYTEAAFDSLESPETQEMRAKNGGGGHHRKGRGVGAPFSLTTSSSSCSSSTSWSENVRMQAWSCVLSCKALLST